MAENKWGVLTLIPAFNVENTIAKVVSQALKYSRFVGVCDDGSTDATRDILKTLNHSRLYVFSHAENMGKGAALRTLFNWARFSCGNVAVTIDADGQHSSRDIPKLALPVLRGEADVACGRRMNMTPFRRVGNKFLHYTETDIYCGFRAYSSRALLYVNITENRFNVDEQIYWQLKNQGFKFQSVTININYDGFSHSTNPVKLFMELFSYKMKKHS